MAEKTENLSRPGETPREGDYVRTTFDSGVVLEAQFHEPDTISDDEKKEAAKNWRDDELAKTDRSAQIPDWPNRDAILAYRVKLRDWPSTSDFPDTKPTL